MGIGFDTPLGGLAIEMAIRNMEAKKKAGEQNQYEQDLVNKRLEMYGGDIKDYQNVWDRGYGGTMQAAQSQAQALQDYWTGLPEIMVAAAKEQQATGGTGTSSSMPTTPGLTAAQQYTIASNVATPPWTAGNPVTQKPQVGADVIEQRSAIARRAKAAAPRLKSRRVYTPQMGR